MPFDTAKRHERARLPEPGENTFYDKMEMLAQKSETPSSNDKTPFYIGEKLDISD